MVFQAEAVAAEGQECGRDNTDDGETQPIDQIAPACEH